MKRLPMMAVMERAFATKDPAFDGTFFVAVKTTGIFCRPTCRAKPPKLINVEFFGSANEAVRRGYRPCKLCRPMGTNVPPLVQQLMNSGPLSEQELKQAGIDPSTARRQFKRYLGTTFAEFQRARKVGRAVKHLRKGKNMTTAQLDAGYESTSGFRDALSRYFGGNGSASGAADATVLAARWISTPLGPMIALAADDGLVMLDFSDQRGLEIAVQRMRKRFEHLHVAPQEHPLLFKLEKELAEYFAGKRRTFTLPLRPHGTDFEMKAWEFLQTIPYGQTRSYGEQARGMKNPAAVRAVGRANGRNDMNILIPCHRVIGANGDLTGYGGGVARKRWLLDHERRVLGGRE